MASKHELPERAQHIFEFNGDKFRFNVENLAAICTPISDIRKISLISVIGDRESGKTFLLNCIINYLESNSKDEWPKCADAVLIKDYGFRQTITANNSVIKIWPKAYILEEIAVLLIDADFLIDDNDISVSLINLLVRLSSTVIFNSHSTIRNHDISILEKSLPTADSTATDLFEKLLFVVCDWNPTDTGVGFESGDKYINSLLTAQLRGLSDRVECYLMSKSEEILTAETIDLSSLDDRFTTYLSKLIHYKLLNTDEMPAKLLSTDNCFKYLSSHFAVSAHNLNIKLYENSNFFHRNHSDDEDGGNNSIANHSFLSIASPKVCENNHNGINETNVGNDFTNHGSESTSVLSSLQIASEFSHIKLDSVEQNLQNSTEDYNHENSDRSFVHIDSSGSETNSTLISELGFESEKNLEAKFDSNHEYYTSDEDKPEESCGESKSDGNTDRESNAVIVVDLTDDNEENNSSQLLSANHIDGNRNGVDEKIMNNLEEFAALPDSESNSLKLIENNFETKSVTDNAVNRENGSDLEFKASLDAKSSEDFTAEIIEKLSKPWRKVSNPGLDTVIKNVKVYVPNYSAMSFEKQSDNYANNGRDKQVFRDEGENVGQTGAKIKFDAKSLVTSREKYFANNKGENQSIYRHNLLKDFFNDGKNKYTDSSLNSPENQSDEQKAYLSNNCLQLSANQNQTIIKRNTTEEINMRASFSRDNSTTVSDFNRDSNDNHYKDYEKSVNTIVEQLVDYHLKGIRDQEYDTEYDFNEAIKTIKAAIIKEYEEKAKLLAPIVAKVFNAGRDRLSTEIKSIQTEKKQELMKGLAVKCFEEALILAVNDYESEMKYAIKTNSKNIALNDLNVTHQICSDIAVYMFTNAVKPYCDYQKLMTEYILKLENQLISLRDSKYSKFFQCYDKYISIWRQLYESKIYLSENEMQTNQDRLKTQIVDSIKIDSDLRELLGSTFDSVFKMIAEQNFLIKTSETTVAENVTELAVELYSKRLTDALKSGLFTPQKVDEINKQLITHSLDSIKQAFDFSANHSSLKCECERNFKIKTESQYKVISKDYKEKRENATEILNKVVNDSLKKYCSKMDETFAAAKGYIKDEAFENSHKNCVKQALVVCDLKCEFIRNEFTKGFAEKLIDEKKEEIRKSIVSHRENYGKRNETNAPEMFAIAVYFNSQHVIAATFVENCVQFIPDKAGYIARPNSIAFTDDILLFGDAFNYYTNTFADCMPKAFDTRLLLGRDRSELTQFPFHFLEEKKLRVKVDNHYLKDSYLSIESILALLLIAIKNDSEMLYKKPVTMCVLTVPHWFTIRRNKAIKDAVKIAGIENAKIISEISASVMAYINSGHKNRFLLSDNQVLIIAVNKFICEAAFCRINDKITYLSYAFQNLIGFNGKTNARISYKSLYNELLNKVKRLSNIHPNSINHIIVCGSSDKLDDIKRWTSEYFLHKPLFECDSSEIIAIGAAIYGQHLKSNSCPLIFNIAAHELSCGLRSNLSAENRNDSKLIYKFGQWLPSTKLAHYYSPFDIDMPCFIDVYQDNEKCALYKADSLPPLNHANWYHCEINFTIKTIDNIEVQPLMCTYNKKCKKSLELIEARLDLSDEELDMECEKIAHIMKKIKEKEIHDKVLVEKQKARDELNRYYLDVKSKLESNTEIRSMLKREIERHLSRIETILSDNNASVAEFKSGRDDLSKVVDTLMK